jgi:hypothetical protein
MGLVHAQQLALPRARALPASARPLAVAGATSGLLVLGLNALLARVLYPDSYLDLAAGRFVARHGIPHREVWAVAAAGRPWIDQQWLAHLAYYATWTAGGYPLVALLSAASVALAFGVLGALIAARGVAPHRAALWAVIAYGACETDAVVRAQSFAFPLFVALLTLLERDRRGRSPSWGLAAAVGLLVLWANLHGTVLMAVGLLGLHCVLRALAALRERRRRPAAIYAAIACSAPLTLAATPYGFAEVTYYHSLIGNPVVAAHVLEWSAPGFDSFASYGFFAVLLLAFAAFGYARGRSLRVETTEIVQIAILAALATQAIRYELWFVLAAVPFVAATFADARGSRPGFALPLARLLPAAAVLVAAVGVGGLLRTSSAQFEVLAPRGAVAAAAVFAERHPASRILADVLSSSPLLWLEPPTADRVGYDVRFAQFRRSDLREWFDFDAVGGPDWFRVARGYDVIVASSRNPRLVSQLRRLHGWTYVYRGGDGVVLARSRSRMS